MAAQDKAHEVAGQAQEKAQAVAGQAQEKAQEAMGQARGQVRTQVDQRSTEAGERVSSQASDIRSVGQQLREQGKDGPAKMADQAADRLERVGSYLTDNDADRILDDVEQFARKNPWAVMAGGLALGFVASRFLKASSVQRYETRSSPYSPYTSQTQRQLGAGYAGDRRFERPATTSRPVPGPPSSAGMPGVGLSGERDPERF